MKKTLAELASIVGGKVVGDEKLVITGLNGINEAKEGDITFVSNSKYIPFIKKTKASAIITSEDIDVEGKSILRTDNPSLAFSKILSFFTKDTCEIKGIHKTAVIEEDVKVGKNVAIGPHVVIEKGSTIGDNTIINAGCYVGQETSIGNNCLIYPNVVIREKSVIGDRVIMHSGVVIGSDGFGFVKIDGKHKKIPQAGSVVVEDDVEIGANTCVDRARFGKTIIGKGTKIDNLVQIAHNVIIGENCIFVSQTGIAGSAVIEDDVIFAGQSAAIGHLTIGRGAIIAARGVVTKTVPAGQMVSGFPAKSHSEEKKINVHIQKLPGYAKTIKELKKEIEALKAKLTNE
ncbi:MAG: UDP-3-O-(3-hydroxymyristoyl)glucosamine N-acyltransferase [Candidatus Zapsychrus exili]|nr:UDP-3-O-(3-hydroxymyristoyl)glucosamine N-acyltransferase [Candidatus Zapsychrus exili]